MKYLLFLLCLFELLLVTYWKNCAGPFISPVLFFIASISIAVIYIRQPVVVETQTSFRYNAIYKSIQIILFIGLSVFIFISLRHIWATYEVSMNAVDRSDVIPQVMYLVRRFNSGQQPYYTIPFPWKLYPTYLPFQWLPYLLAEWAHKDYRWVPAIALELSCAYLFIKSFLREDLSTHPIIKIIGSIWPLIIWAVLIRYDQGLFAITIEALVASYYLLVCTGIFNRRVSTLAIAISFCLLSRYSIVFWVPVCLACYYISGQKKAAYTILLTICLFFIVFYWFPFLRHDPYIFWKGYQYHAQAALYDWTHEHYLYNGLGFSSFAVRYLPGTIGTRLHIYQAMHLLACVTTFILCVYYYKKKKHQYDLKKYLLFSLKIYLTVFYLFLQTPYNYLYIVPLMISAGILGSAVRSPEKKDAVADGSAK